MEMTDSEPIPIGPMLVRCICGWETRGTEGEVVPATQEHGRRIHNMETTREQVLAMAASESSGLDS
jgi:predicted small metal-binding protein